MTSTTSIDKSDLEAKLREIEGVVLDAEDTARSRMVVIAAGVAIAVVGVVAISMWRSRRSRIKVEVYRL